MISVDVWAEIRYLHASEGLSGRAIAARLGVARKTVAKVLDADGPPSYRARPLVEGVWSRVEPAIRALLVEFPDLPATVLAQRVGWEGSITWSRQNVAEVRRGVRRVDPADRLVHRPGELRAAGFPAVKTLEEFNFDHQPAADRPQLHRLTAGGYLTVAGNVVLLGPPGTGKTPPSKLRAGRHRSDVRPELHYTLNRNSTTSPSCMM